jgi:hypothetical protein
MAAMESYRCPSSKADAACSTICLRLEVSVASIRGAKTRHSSWMTRSGGYPLSQDNCRLSDWPAQVVDVFLPLALSANTLVAPDCVHPSGVGYQAIGMLSGSSFLAAQ